MVQGDDGLAKSSTQAEKQVPFTLLRAALWIKRFRRRTRAQNDERVAYVAPAKSQAKRSSDDGCGGQQRPRQGSAGRSKGGRTRLTVRLYRGN